MDRSSHTLHKTKSKIFNRSCTDESSLFDFEPEIPVADSLKKILETYGLTETEVRDLRLVAICGVIRGWATH